MATPCKTPMPLRAPCLRALALFNERALDRFRSSLNSAIQSHSLLRIVLANYGGSEPQLQRVMVRPVQLKGQVRLSFVYRYQKDITKNLPTDEGVQPLMRLSGMGGFKNVHLHTPTQEIQRAFSKKGKASLRVGAVAGPGQVAGQVAGGMGDPVDGQEANEASQAPTQSHNRDKHRYLEQTRPFLRELGVTNAQGHLIPAMSRKWKQINKFVEVFDAALARSPLAQLDTVHVVDFGSGKGYLTLPFTTTCNTYWANRLG
ncbi:MAG: hypothetical protein ACK4F8_08185 [Aquabacterium sp.]